MTDQHATDRFQVIDSPLSGDMARNWDKFVESHPLGWVTHLTGWKRVLEESFQNIRAHCLMLLDSASGEIVAGIPIYVSESWIKGKRLVSIPLATLCDPLVSETEGLDLLWNRLRLLQTETSSSYVEIRASRCDPAILHGVATETIFDYKSHSLSLDSDLDSILMRCHRTSIRHSIQRGTKAGLETVETCRDIDKFFELYHRTRKRLGLPTLPRRFFEAIIDHLGNAGKASLLAATLEGKWIAALLLLKWKGRVSADALGWEAEYDRLSPGCFVFWHAIRLAHEQGYKVFDFGRTHKSNIGLMDHKRRWGTQVSDLPIYYITESPRSLINRGESSVPGSFLIRDIIRFGPAPLARLLGSFWYNYLA
jgi:CelD/BcsL family acetyltransferase involved in cellulose biosynthesis